VPEYDEVRDLLEARLHLVPRYRQRLTPVPLGQGRPVWADDPHFNLRYHLRHTGLPSPGGPEQLKLLAGRIFSQRLDRSKPLWEIWLVEGLSGDRFALISKTHHALVDGISGVDIVSVLFDLAPDAAPPAPPAQPWLPRPVPTTSQLLAEALLERSIVPAEAGRGLRALAGAPRQIAGKLAACAVGVGEFALGGLAPAPSTPLNVDIGPHRRYTWVDADLDAVRAVKRALGGTVNDAVLSAVSLALGRWLRDRGEDTDGLTLRAMVPVSVRADTHRGALGNRVAAMWAPVPVGEADPADCFAAVHAATAHLKDSGQAVGATRLTQLADFAPPTILTQAARLQPRQRFFNLVVTNVPGPQLPLYLLGHRLTGLYPVVPLAQRQALGIAVMSYDGRMGFGLLGDYDALADLHELAGHLRGALADLQRSAGVRVGGASNGVRRRRPDASRAATPR
jgi:WS/DGAT/MGAT family acyltransferase